jgi:hypothetical protein
VKKTLFVVLAVLIALPAAWFAYVLVVDPQVTAVRVAESNVNDPDSPFNDEVVRELPDGSSKTWSSREDYVKEMRPALAKVLAANDSNIREAIDIATKAPAYSDDKKTGGVEQPEYALDASMIGQGASKRCLDEADRVWILGLSERIDNACKKLEARLPGRARDLVWGVAASHYAADCKRFQIYAPGWPSEQREVEQRRAAKGRWQFVFGEGTWTEKTSTEPHFLAAKALIDPIEGQIDAIATRENCLRDNPGLAKPSVWVAPGTPPFAGAPINQP